MAEPVTVVVGAYDFVSFCGFNGQFLSDDGDDDDAGVSYCSKFFVIMIIIITDWVSVCVCACVVDDRRVRIDSIDGQFKAAN